MLPRLTLLYAVRPMKIRNLVKLQSKADILTKEQVDKFSPRRNPDYLLLGQILIEDGLLTNSQFEELLAEYQASNEIDDLKCC